MNSLTHCFNVALCRCSLLQRRSVQIAPTPHTMSLLSRRRRTLVVVVGVAAAAWVLLWLLLFARSRDRATVSDGGGASPSAWARGGGTAGLLAALPPGTALDDGITDAVEDLEAWLMFATCAARGLGPLRVMLWPGSEARLATRVFRDHVRTGKFAGARAVAVLGGGRGLQVAVQGPDLRSDDRHRPPGRDGYRDGFSIDFDRQVLTLGLFDAKDTRYRDVGPVAGGVECLQALKALPLRGGRGSDSVAAGRTLAHTEPLDWVAIVRSPPP